MTAVWGEVTVRSNQHVCFLEMTSASRCEAVFLATAGYAIGLECCDFVADRDAQLRMLDMNIYIYTHVIYIYVMYA